MDTAQLSLKRALIGFVVAYAAITVLAFGLYLVLAAFMGVSTSPAFDLRKDPAYQLAEALPGPELAAWGTPHGSLR